MNTKKHGRREEIRYSEAFKMEVVRELEAGGLAFEDIAMKYGINGKGTVPRWVRQYGNGTRGKVIRVESPGEINELRRLKARGEAVGKRPGGCEHRCGVGAGVYAPGL